MLILAGMSCLAIFMILITVEFGKCLVGCKEIKSMGTAEVATFGVRDWVGVRANLKWIRLRCVNYAANF